MKSREKETESLNRKTFKKSTKNKEAKLKNLYQGNVDASLIDTNQEINGAYTINQKITEHKRSEEEIKRLAQENAIMAEIGRIISSTLEIEEVYERFAEEVRKIIPFDRLAINTINPDNRTITIAYAIGIEIPGRRQGDVVSLGGTLTEEIFRTRSRVIVQMENEADLEERFPSLLPSFRVGFRSFMSVPLISKDRVIGVLHFRSVKFNAYSEMDLRLAEGVGNQIAGNIANAQLFTDYRRTAEMLRESEERYRTLVEESFDGIFIQKGLKIIFANHRLHEMLGYREGELEGLDHWLVYHPDYQGLTRERAQARMRGESVPSQYEVKLLRKDGSSFYGEINAKVIGFSGEPGIQVWVRDITERKQAEEILRTERERFRSLSENAPFGMAMVDKNGTFKYINPRFRELFGYDLNDVPDGRTWFRKAYPDRNYRHQVISAWLNDLTSSVSGEKRPRVFTVKCKDGSEKIINFIPVQLETGENLMTCDDITGLKQAEEALRRTEEQLRQSQKMEAIGRLGGGIAHDFNNLLTVIKGYGQISLLELKKDDPLRGNIEEIQKAAERAANLTRQLLAFSRRQVLDFKVLNLNLLLQDLDKMLRRILGEDIELVYALAEDLQKIKTDPSQVEQVILNLAVNARDAMPSGGKLIIETANVELDNTYASTHVGVTPGRYVRLSMSDTGLGMTPEVRDRAFEPFFTTKEKGRGTGLGLSTVYGIVKQSGGNIWVYSEPGIGTTFKIYLPGVDEKEDVLQQKKEDIPLSRGTETILLAEDEPSLRDLASRILRDLGYDLIIAANGEEAIQIAQEQSEKEIHLLLTDVVMPRMGGKELADRLKISRPKMKVLFASGYTDDTIVHHGVLERGINYIQKPFTPDTLARTVRQVLDR